MTIFERVRNLIPNIVEDVHGTESGFVTCRQCKRVEQVNFATCYAQGWPKCCGYTMTIDRVEGAVYPKKEEI